MPNLLPEEAGVELQLWLGEGDGAVTGHEPGQEVGQTRAAATIIPLSPQHRDQHSDKSHNRVQLCTALTALATVHVMLKM